MNYTRIFLAALGAWAIYFAIGGVVFTMTPLADEFRNYPAVYRTQESMKGVMPAGMAAMFVAMIAMAAMYALIYRGGSGLAEGVRLGALIGIFSVCAFVVHNYVNLNIGLRLTVGQGVAYLVEWIAAGVVIGLIYRPAAA